jgi:hypothetical protein
MTMPSKFLLALALVTVVLLVIVASQPSYFRIERSIIISAPPAELYAQVNDLRQWQQMSPYVKLDLTAKYTFAGPSAGPGASLAWVGNNQVGVGRITITESRPFELVRMRLEFAKPFACTNAVEFTFRQTGTQTAATWSMFGKHNFIGKAMALVMDMDKLCGAQFEEGLANLKSRSEATVSN